ncbi:helix-turn-helix domain-containing protein [Aquimarina sp. 2201CG14-23]|uniref:helix-turn-helix domain-containing protein n=1 Tax=Aquimarina mycalae TaxID=3040073 RepID=UPI0024780B09|nr:helix-turn-helix transcriptional regulator [Aquimarina sp. 2201CG14-23]MDH7444694.1 helix-turn-helix transcriptional regulator [Aquimarina sp. 2201CG14-23]
MFNKEEISVIKNTGDRIRELREKKGLSQDRLAIEADIPKNQIGRIERYEINTTILTLHKIAKALDVDICKLF